MSETPKAFIATPPITYDSAHHKWWLCHLKKYEDKEIGKKKISYHILHFLPPHPFSSSCNKVFLKDLFYWLDFIIVHDSIYLVRNGSLSTEPLRSRL